MRSATRSGMWCGRSSADRSRPSSNGRQNDERPGHLAGALLRVGEYDRPRTRVREEPSAWTHAEADGRRLRHSGLAQRQRAGLITRMSPVRIRDPPPILRCTGLPRSGRALSRCTGAHRRVEDQTGHATCGNLRETAISNIDTGHSADGWRPQWTVAARPGTLKGGWRAMDLPPGHRPMWTNARQKESPDTGRKAVSGLSLRTLAACGPVREPQVTCPDGADVRSARGLPEAPGSRAPLADPDWPPHPRLLPVWPTARPLSAAP
jgi:hypothetical protein